MTSQVMTVRTVKVMITTTRKVMAIINLCNNDAWCITLVFLRLMERKGAEDACTNLFRINRGSSEDFAMRILSSMLRVALMQTSFLFAGVQVQPSERVFR